ncbi:MAG: SIMPL domain-containing protein [Propionibacteriaceae bacterium]|nr:SIMPL domain-containing protein [Propionibacteriaceae bacterium]
MGILRITVDDSVRVEAESARVHLTVRGSATVFGNAATKQAAEVRTLVGALSTMGIGEDAIEVTGVRLDSRGGVLGKSQAEYLLAVTARPSQLPSLLGVLADQANLKLTELEWVFDPFEASIGATAAALTKARRKADAVAAAAGGSIAGIAMISDSWNLPAPRVAFAAEDAAVFRSAKASAPIDLGIEINATQELFVHLTVDFELA